jgi:hypothetical protein
MKCDGCNKEIPEEEIHEHAGQNLCDDCYMDAMEPATGCDPWAVYLGTRTRDKDQTYTPVQEAILALVKEKGRVEVPELLKATGLDPSALQKEVVTLRHMEKVIWERRPDNSFVLKAFNDPNKT